MWHRLVSRRQLVLGNTLLNGQCFNWIKKDDIFVGVISNHAIELRDVDDFIEYRSINVKGENLESEDQLHQTLYDYFQLDSDMITLYHEWGQAWPQMKIIGQCIPGVRIVRQDPLECLLSFICSSNNNITRITSMLMSLRSKYGSPMDTTSDVPLYKFPSLEQLLSVQEEDLRKMGFGYRAKYFVNTVQKVHALGGVEWLFGLRNLEQTDDNLNKVREHLIQLDGVGPKVADCVALFCLDRKTVIPVDTHVWQIACRDFDDTLLSKASSVTPSIYHRVGDCFRSRFGSHAGWAHSLLFTAELPSFRKLLPENIQENMKAFTMKEKERKVAIKQRRRVEDDDNTENIKPPPTRKKIKKK